MDPFALLGAAGAGGGLPSITGGTAGPSTATGGDQALGGFGGISFSSPFAVGSGASSSASTAQGASALPTWALVAGGALVLLLAVLALRR